MLDALDGSGIAPEAVRHFVLGTTIATNARLQGTGARVIYLATAGFEDIPLIGSISRPHAYDLSWRRPEPGVARRDCLGVRERIDYHGHVITALEDAEIARVLDEVGGRNRRERQWRQRHGRGLLHRSQFPVQLPQSCA